MSGLFQSYYKVISGLFSYFKIISKLLPKALGCLHFVKQMTRHQKENTTVTQLTHAKNPGKLLWECWKCNPQLK